VREARLPQRARLLEPPVGDAVQRQLVQQDVLALGQEVLRRADDEVEGIQPRPRAPHVHQPRAVARLFLDPPRDRLQFSARADHEVRPGRLQRAAAAPVDTGERQAAELARDHLRHPRQGMEADGLQFEGPAQRFAEPEHLVVVAGPGAVEEPYAWLVVAAVRAAGMQIEHRGSRPVVMTDRA
jgi:hypothetical protein